MDFEISLNQLRFFALHGVLPEEQKLGNEFIVDLTVRIPARSSILEDNLDSTVSYEDLFFIVEEEMALPRKLLERLAMEIAEKIKRKFPQVISGLIKIEKLRPPIAGMIGSASVSLNF